MNPVPDDDFLRELVGWVQEALSDDLRRAPWKSHLNPLAGHCYVACEAIVHMGFSGWEPQFIRHEGAPHWFLRNKSTGAVLDPTAGQFETPVPYDNGKGKGFLTKEPSKRAQLLINRVGKVATASSLG